MRSKCACCDEVVDGMPSYGWDQPLACYYVPEEKRGAEVRLTSDTCVISDRWYFVRGCIEIPVRGAEEPFVWGVWVSLDASDFDEFESLLGVSRRSHFGPYGGWLSADFDPYPNCENLQVSVHLRDDGIRPLVRVEDMDHPLAAEQRNGITVDRVSEIYARMEHEARRGAD